MSKVTVLIPNYNSNLYPQNNGKTLRLAIESALNQNIDVDVIVHDDCSPEPFSVEGLEVTLVRSNKNIGHAESINRLVSMVKTAYFSILDSDDQYYSDRSLKTLLDGIKGKDYCYGDFMCMEDGKYSGMWKYKPIKAIDVPKQIKKYKGGGVIPFNHGLHRTRFWRDNNIKFELINCADTLASIKACEAGLKMKHIAFPMTRYTVGGGMSKGKTRKIGIKKIMNYLINERNNG